MIKPIKLIAIDCVVVAWASIICAQTKSDSPPQELYSHGTCATSILAPFGAAFVIDSRITQTDQNGTIVSQTEGCKVLLPRPTILIAGVGLEDATGIGGHWNSLDEAAKALKRLPENPTEQQLDLWGDEWGFSLVNHFRKSGIIPPFPGHVSEMVLITKIGNEPYYRRTTIAWNGSKFELWGSGQDLEKWHPYILYSGSCREFVAHSSDEGGSLVPAKYRNFWETFSLNQIGTRAKAATTVGELAVSALELERVLTQIDVRIEGDHAGIAPPYATAEWVEGAEGWTTNFNAKCDLNNQENSQKTPVTPGSAPVREPDAKPSTTISDTPQKKNRSFFQRIFGRKDDKVTSTTPESSQK